MTQRYGFKLAQRVELHPGCDDWMRGDRYGDVIGFASEGKVEVELDKSGKRRWFHFNQLTAI